MGGGAMFFGGKHFLSANLIERKNYVYEMGRKKYSVGTLGLKKYCFCRKKLMSRQVVAKKKFCCARSEKKNLTPKKPIAPPPP